MQVEYATDLVFRSVGTLRPLYEHLARESVLSVKAEQIANFLGRQISPQLAQEIGSQFSTRIEGTCIKHRFACSSISTVKRVSSRSPAVSDRDRCRGRRGSRPSKADTGERQTLRWRKQSRANSSLKAKFPIIQG